MLPLNEQAYNYLQKLILENHFSYQEVYSETKLSKELGISRTPLRDAVHRLAQEGYIDIIPKERIYAASDEPQRCKRNLSGTFRASKHIVPSRSVKSSLPVRQKSFLKILTGSWNV